MILAALGLATGVATIGYLLYLLVRAEKTQVILYGWAWANIIYGLAFGGIMKFGNGIVEILTYATGIESYLDMPGYILVPALFIGFVGWIIVIFGPVLYYPRKD